MAIRMRRGLLSELDESKLLAGEWAVTIDPETNRQKVLMCFGAGIVKQMGTYNDFVDMIEEISEDILDEYKEELNTIKSAVESIASDVSADKDAVVLIQTNITDVLIPQIQGYVSDAETAKTGAETAKAGAEQAKTDAEGEVTKAAAEVTKAEGEVTKAKGHADDSASNATLSKSYAVGGTGTRAGEDADNAKYYYEQTKAISGGDFVPNAEKGVANGVATLDSNGKVPTTQLPDMTIPTASETVLGGIKVGDNLSVDSDGVLSADVDSAMSATSTNPVQNKVIYAEIDELKNSVSDGKTLVANAITEKGVETATDATFEVMAENIAQIETGPSYNYKGWCRAGGVDPTSYSNLDEVLADQVTVRRLMTVHASVNFLKEWMFFETSIIDTFVASEYAMKWMGLRDYAYDTLTANVSGLESKILASTNWKYALKDHVPVMTSYTAPYGEVFYSSMCNGDESAYGAWHVFDGKLGKFGDRVDWISGSKEANSYVGYKFTNPIRVNKISVYFMPLDKTSRTVNYVVQASNDGTTYTTLTNPKSISCNSWVDTSFENDSYYIYYRVYITGTMYNGGWDGYLMEELQFYGRSLNVSVPNMTSNTEPYGECFASSYYDTLEPYGLDYSEREFAEGSTMKYIYDHGIKFDLVTEGNITEDENSIYITCTSKSEMNYVSANNMIDMSEYKVIKAYTGDETITANGSIAVLSGGRTNAHGGTWIARHMMSMPGILPNAYLDVSSVNDTLYLSWQLGHNDTAKGSIKEWWLE